MLDPSKGITFDNLKVIRSFSGLPSESAFILVHVTMVSHTPSIIASAKQALQAAASKDRASFNTALVSYYNTMCAINKEMDTMWIRSKPEDYQRFRVFIMGTKDQPMFPNGVYYEARSPYDPKVIIQDGPHYYRGESGANDSIIPTTDNLLQITDQMPNNPLTDILQDFRTYRPCQHNSWLSFVHQESQAVGFKQFALQDNTSAMNFLSILDQVRDFRHRHWQFTKEYIIKRSSHPVATGGSPIIDWLPNQLTVVLQMMEHVSGVIDAQALSSELEQRLQVVRTRLSTQTKLLHREVCELKEDKQQQQIHKGCPM
jgi:indoleamine 2,3-dioxygenase